MGVKREEFFKSLLNKRADKLLTGARVFVGRKDEERVDAISRQDRQEWAEAYDPEHQGFYEHQTLKITRPKPNAKILGTTTRTEYKTVNGQFTKARCDCV
jgi:hypothetical protein